MILVSSIVSILYVALIGRFIYGFDKVPVFSLQNLPSKTKFSVVIPFRNESENLPSLLDSINELHYPNHLFEVILVDDASEDHSVAIINTFLNTDHTPLSPDISIIRNKRHSKSPKKDAITTAIAHSKYEWIITTDADCILPKFWLDSYDECIQNTHGKCIIGPVKLMKDSSMIVRFQILDILSLQGATIGAFGINKPFMCNGANFAYKKALFIKLKGFDGNDDVASGDDIFLLEKIYKQLPESTFYLKSEHATVITKPETNWTQLVSQRVRWASKTTAYNTIFWKLVGLVVLTMNVLIIAVLILFALGQFKSKVLLYILVIKFNIDFYLIYKSATFFNQKHSLKDYIIAFAIYPFFSVLVALASVFKTYSWKGRHFKG